MDSDRHPSDTSSDGASPPATGTLRIGEIGSCGLTALYDYWRGSGSHDRPMRRDQLDLARIAPLLCRIILAEVVDGGRDLVIRVAGEEIESRFHGSMRGLKVSAIFNSLPSSPTTRQWLDIVADRQPRYRRGPIPYAQDRYFYSERLLLPLCDEAGAVTHVVGAAFYHAAPEDGRSAPVIDAIVVD